MKYLLSWLIMLGILYTPNVFLFSQTNPDQPNILVIIADDLGVDVSNGYQDNPLMPNTPALDGLRASGLTFLNAWATPACTPTRATMISGKYGLKTGVTEVPGNLDTSHTSIFTAITEQTGDAYQNAVIGKWHISLPVDLNHPQQHGIDHFAGVIRSGVDDYYNWEKVTNGVESMETTYATSFFTDAAIEWVNEQDNPWLLWLSEVAPHSPYHEPPPDLFSITPIGSNRRKYIAAIEAMDAEIGRLFDHIPDSVLSNTLIVYLGDNGTPGNVIQQFPSDHGKGRLYQGGIHVPMLISGPPVTRVNETESALVAATDIYATILEVIGAELPGGIYNSFSLFPLLSDPTEGGRPYNYTEFTEPDNGGWTIREAQYKLIHFADGTQEFYDLLIDPLESMNLIAELDPDQMAIKAALEAEASDIQTGWSCADLIQNGDEAEIDCGGTYCSPCEIASVGEPEKSSEVRVYPNPTSGRVTFAASKGKLGSIDLLTLTGQLVYSIRDINNQEIRVDLSKWPLQTLIARIRIEQSILHRVIVQH